MHSVQIVCRKTGARTRRTHHSNKRSKGSSRDMQHTRDGSDRLRPSDQECRFRALHQHLAITLPLEYIGVREMKNQLTEFA